MLTAACTFMLYEGSLHSRCCTGCGDMSSLLWRSWLHDLQQHAIHIWACHCSKYLWGREYSDATANCPLSHEGMATGCRRNGHATHCGIPQGCSLCKKWSTALGELNSMHYKGFPAGGSRVQFLNCLLCFWVSYFCSSYMSVIVIPHIPLFSKSLITIMIMILWNVTVYSPVGFFPEDGRCRFLKKTGTILSIYIAFYPRRH